MATALHPQTLLALDFGGKPLPADYGYPLRLRVPTKLGFKNAKHIAAIFVSDVNPGGYWEDQAITGSAAFSFAPPPSAANGNGAGRLSAAPPSNRPYRRLFFSLYSPAVISVISACEIASRAAAGRPSSVMMASNAAIGNAR